MSIITSLSRGVSLSKEYGVRGALACWAAYPQTLIVISFFLLLLCCQNAFALVKNLIYRMLKNQLKGVRLPQYYNLWQMVKKKATKSRPRKPPSDRKSNL